MLCPLNHILQLLAWASCDTSQPGQILAALHWPCLRSSRQKPSHQTLAFQAAPEVFPEYLLSCFTVGKRLMCPKDIAHLVNDIASHHKPYFFLSWTSLTVTAPALTPWTSICTTNKQVYVTEGCLCHLCSELKGCCGRDEAEREGSGQRALSSAFAASTLPPPQQDLCIPALVGLNPLALLTHQ